MQWVVATRNKNDHVRPAGPGPRRTGSGTAVVLVIAALVLGSVAVPAAAQSGVRVAELLDRIADLETDVRSLRRELYARGTPVDPRATVPSTAPTRAADFEVRLVQLETQIRDLTGQVEQALFRLSRLTDRMEQVSSDVDLRLSRLQGGAGTAAARPVPDSRTATAATPPPAAVTQPATPASSSLPGGGPQADYDFAFGLLRRADYAQAEQAFREFVGRHADHTLAGNAQYWLAETFYVRGLLPEAALAFAEGIERFPNSSKAPDNLLKLGMALAALNQRTDACAAFGRLSRQYPDAAASLARRAEQERRQLECP